MNRGTAFVAGVAGACIFTSAIAFAQWKNAVHLPQSEAIVCGLIAAVGFALMASSVRFRAMVIVDAAVILALYFVVIPILKSGAGERTVDRGSKAKFGEATRLYRAGRFGEAVPLFDEYLKTNPNDALANARIAICLGELGHLQAAVPYAKKAIDLDPSDYQSRSNLGLIYEKLNRPEEGIEWERQADRIKPNDPEVLNNLGWVLMRAGHNSEAAGIFERAIQLAPNVALYRENLNRARSAMR